MPTVRVKENEPFEVAMRRFKRTVEKTGLLTEQRREQVAFEVVDPDRRHVERSGQRMGERGAYEQRAGEAGALGVGDGGQIRGASPAPGEQLPRQGHHATHMIPRRQLRHDASIHFVHRDLRMHDMAEQPPGRTGARARGRFVESDAGFVARGLDSEDQHEVRF